jgi:hypothetical protein
MARCIGLAERFYQAYPARDNQDRALVANWVVDNADLEPQAQEWDIAQNEYEHETELEAARSVGLM